MGFLKQILPTQKQNHGVGDDLFNITNFVLCIFGVLIAHLSVNVLNDYFDVKDGTDEENNDYFQQVS